MISRAAQTLRGEGRVSRATQIQTFIMHSGDPSAAQAKAACAPGRLQRRPPHVAVSPFEVVRPHSQRHTANDPHSEHIAEKMPVPPMPPMPYYGRAPPLVIAAGLQQRPAPTTGFAPFQLSGILLHSPLCSDSPLLSAASPCKQHVLICGSIDNTANHSWPYMYTPPSVIIRPAISMPSMPPLHAALAGRRFP